MREILSLLVMSTTITIALVFAGLLLKRLWIIWVALAILWFESTPVIGTSLIRFEELTGTTVPLPKVSPAPPPRARGFSWSLPHTT